MDHTQPYENEGVIKTVFSAMWRNWALAFGAMMLPMFCALFLRRMWLPFICFAEIYVLVTMMRSNLFAGVRACSLVIRLAVRVLVVSMCIMFAVLILCTDWLVPASVHLELYNAEIPFVTCLIIFPVIAVFGVMALASGQESRHCRNCRRYNGFYAGDNIIGTLYYRESRYQILMMLLVSVLLGAIEYWYYFDRYINSNFNAPDRFFFIYMPVAVYVISLVVMGTRYASMCSLYSTVEEARPERVNTTRVRFLVFCGNDLLLHQGENGIWDTPLETVVGSRQSMGTDEARFLFSGLSGVEKFDMRYCYTSPDIAAGANTMHYAVFVDAGNCDSVKGEPDCWYTAYMLDFALQNGCLAGTLASELYRIHTITMAWKTYDRQGRRRYPIKHYRPTFRLGDLREWDVDYDDTSWFGVAFNNEDRRFYHLRSLWRRITGVFGRNTGKSI